MQKSIVKKPSLKALIVQNLIMNIPIALAMSISASLLSGNGITARTWWLALLGFVLACIINVVFPIPKILVGFAGLFKVNPDSLGGALVGNIAVNFLFVTIINLVMTAINVPVLPDFFFAFLGLYIPLYLICYVVSFLVSKPALMAAAAVDNS